MAKNAFSKLLKTVRKTHFYTAYGSNLSVEQMKWRCPDAEIIGSSVMHGWGLRFRGVATVEPCEGEDVPVIVWRISDSDEKSLDRYEGFPCLYRKEYIRLNVGGKWRITMIYIMNENTRGYGTPSQCYYDTILEGYNRFGFDVGVLERAVDKASKHTLSNERMVII